MEFAALQHGRCAFSCIHPNAPTHGPPTSSAVLVNLGNFLLITKNFLHFELFSFTKQDWPMPQVFRFEIAEARPVKPLAEVHFGDGDGAPLRGLRQHATLTVVNRGNHPVQICAAVGAAGETPTRDYPAERGACRRVRLPKERKLAMEPMFPLVSYRGALLLQTRTRKMTKCVQCWQPIPIGGWAWRPVAENIRRGVIRSHRWHVRHFVGGQKYEA